MDPITIMALAGAVSSLVKGGTAFSQNKRANILESIPRPQYSVPSAVNQAVGAARMEYNDPNLYANSLAQQNIQANAAQALQGVRESGAGPNAMIQAASGINAGSNRASRQLSIDATQKRQQYLARLIQAQFVQGQYQDNAFNINQLDPSLEQQQAAQDLRYTARGNVDSLMGDAMNFAGSAAMGSYYNSLYPAPVPTGPSVSAVPMQQAPQAPSLAPQLSSTAPAYVANPLSVTPQNTVMDPGALAWLTAMQGRTARTSP